MTNTAQSEAQELTDLLTQQRDVYLQLRDLARVQRGAIESEGSEDLLRILGDRQRQIRRLTEINSRLEPLRGRWDQLQQGLDDGDRQQVGELVQQVKQLLGEILEQDKGDCETLKERTEASRSGAANIVLGHKLNAAYAAGRYRAPSPRFIDRKDDEGGRR